MTINDFLINLTVFATLTVGVYALIKDLLLQKLNISLEGSIFGLISFAQLGSWITAIVIAMVFNWMGWLGAGGWALAKVLLYGIFAGGVSNGMWNINIIRSIFNRITGKIDK